MYVVSPLRQNFFFFVLDECMYGGGFKAKFSVCKCSKMPIILKNVDEECKEQLGDFTENSPMQKKKKTTEQFCPGSRKKGQTTKERKKVRQFYKSPLIAKN